jgi:ribonuclease Z
VDVLTQVHTNGFTLRGVSLGGIYTSMHVPELDALFDVGSPIRTASTARHLFLSHGHVDHVGGLSSLLGIRALFGHPRPLRIHLPAEIAPALSDALAAMSRLQRYELAFELIPMSPGQEVALRGDLAVRALRTYHPVPSLAYVVIRRVAKLRPELVGLSGREIAERRRSGEVVSESVDRLELAYATDTLAVVLDREPALLDCRVLVLECTFLDGRKSLADARAGCHIHLDELVERAHLFRNEALVLMHFSQIYRPVEVREILARRLPEELRARLVVFAPPGDDWPG